MRITSYLTLLFLISAAADQTGDQFDHQTEKLPPLLVPNYWTTFDIRYGHFRIPHASVSTKLCINISPDKECLFDSVVLFLRPGSLPVVMHGDKVTVPPGVVLLHDFFQVFVNATSKTERDGQILSTSDGQMYLQLRIFWNNQVPSIEVTLFTPKPGTWLYGILYLNANRQTRQKCKVWLFPEVSHDRIAGVRQLSGSVNTVTPPSVRTNSDHPTSNSPPRQPNPQLPVEAVTTASWSGSTPTTTPLHRNRVTVPSGDQINTSSALSHGGGESYYRVLSYDSFSLDLAPLEAKIFVLPISDHMTSLDIDLLDCYSLELGTTAHPLHPPTSRSSSFKNGTAVGCTLLLDASSESLPFGYLRRGRPTSSLPLAALSSKASSFDWPLLRYRMTGLQGRDVKHYLSVWNWANQASLRVTIRLRAREDCQLINSWRGIDSPPSLTVPNTSGKLFQLFAFTSAKQSRAPAGISLLPWLNSRWPQLTSGYSTTSDRRQTSTYTTSWSQQLSDPMDPAHQLVLGRCRQLPPPSRVTFIHAFAFHFTYQPGSGRYSTLLHLQPWVVQTVPIHLDETTDTGGSLEISLQLNALDVTMQVPNASSSSLGGGGGPRDSSRTLQSLPRQVILHACFSQHRPVTPAQLTKCRLWLRLATSHGLFVSIAQAVSDAWRSGLAASQPPHRSERLPSLDSTDFAPDRLDRSFFFLPYPQPGAWFLTFYPECYTTREVFCRKESIALIDVGLVIRSSPCLNYRCRESGEPASLSPSRLMHPTRPQQQTGHRRQATGPGDQPWRPPWWLIDPSSDHLSALRSPINQSASSARPRTFSPEAVAGVCVELNQRAAFASVCACPMGRSGLGCRSDRESPTRSPGGAQPPPPLPPQAGGDWSWRWRPHSADALLLALSNMAFLPAVLLAAVRRLWIPAIVYAYTLVFSALYHICDSDIPSLLETTPSLASSLSTQQFSGRLDTSPSEAVASHLLASSTSRLSSAGFQLIQRCALPLHVLQFCDFFAGVLSVWVTVVTMSGCPLWCAHLAHVLFVLALTVSVQVARHSTGLFLAPALLGLLLCAYYWVYWSLRSGRLFPPVQWWLTSLLPGLLLVSIALALFLSPHMSRDYAVLHSLWHLLLGTSLIGLLPWPNRWRLALTDLVREPLSFTSPACCHSSVSRLQAGLGKRVPRSCWGTGSRLYDLLELDWLLDPLTRRWPRLVWLLPHGYQPGRSRKLFTSNQSYNHPHQTTGNVNISSEVQNCIAGKTELSPLQLA